MNNEHILTVHNLTKHYEAFCLDDLSFGIKKGEITGFIGSNGAGKTTTLRCILGLSPYESGRILLNGRSIKDDADNYKTSLGISLDSDGFYDSFTISQMKDIIGKGYKNWDENAFRLYMEKFSLHEKTRICRLSKGMKVKFALALALSHDAQVLILDEPTSGLDPKSRDIICRELLFQKEQGKTIFFSTHITSDLDKIADNIILIDDGRLLFSGTKSEFLAGKNYDIEYAMLNMISGRSA